MAIVAIILYEQQPSWLVARPAEPTATPTRSAVSYLSDAQDLLAANDYAGGIAALNQVIRLEPGNPAPHVELSKLFLIQRDVARAHEHAQRAVELAPDNPEAMTALAHSLDWLGEYEEALDMSLDSLELAPDSPDTLAVIAEIYTDVGNWEIAQEYLDQALALDSENVTALRNQAYLYERRGNYEAAIDAYNRAIEVAPYRYDLYIERGRQYRVGLLDYERANESYQQAVQVYESAVTLDALGDGLYSTGDHLQAVRVLRRAVELDPEYGPAQVHLGMALYARRNYEDAVPALEKGLTLVGDTARIEQIYTLGLAYIYKDPPECQKAAVWLQKALEIDPESGPAREGLTLCSNVLSTPTPGQ